MVLRCPETKAWEGGRGLGPPPRSFLPAGGMGGGNTMLQCSLGWAWRKVMEWVGQEQGPFGPHLVVLGLLVLCSLLSLFPGPSWLCAQGSFLSLFSRLTLGHMQGQTEQGSLPSSPLLNLTWAQGPRADGATPISPGLLWQKRGSGGADTSLGSDVFCEGPRHPTPPPRHAPPPHCTLQPSQPL